MAFNSGRSDGAGVGSVCGLPGTMVFDSGRSDGAGVGSVCALPGMPGTMAFNVSRSSGLTVLRMVVVATWVYSAVVERWLWPSKTPAFAGAGSE
jgi:hypothetical protein